VLNTIMVMRWEIDESAQQLLVVATRQHLLEPMLSAAAIVTGYASVGAFSLFVWPFMSVSIFQCPMFDDYKLLCC
jgi:hypothetical protein